MIEMSDEQFEQIIGEALDSLPAKYTDSLDNVVVTYEDQPNPEQREQLKLRCNETLFGLYQGIPQIARGAGYNLVLPDKITMFKLPLLAASHDLEEFKRNTKHTLWHEIAHHFGLDHKRIHELEDRNT